MPTNQIAGSFVALRGENCNLTTIGGVKSLITENGIDLVSISTGIETTLLETKKTIKELTERLNKLETLGISERGKDGIDGNDGRDGLQGSSGEKGQTGPRGPRGKVEKLQDVGDIDLDGLGDGATLQWNSDRKKWVIVPSPSSQTDNFIE